MDSYEERERQEKKKLFRMITTGVVSAIVLIFISGCFTIVGPQEQAVVVRLGSIKGTLNSGFNLKAPIIDDVVKLDISTVAIKGSDLAYSKDGQIINVEATVAYKMLPSSVESVYREFKRDYENRIVIPAIKESIKSVVSQYTAQGIIDNRGKLPSEMALLVTERVGDKGFVIESVSITNIDFDDAYENAIKEKQVAEQNALQQVNITKQEDEKKKQEILKAQALAEKTRLEAQALASQEGKAVIEKIYAEAALKASEKWNGVLPTQFVPGSALPFIQLGK